MELNFEVCDSDKLIGSVSRMNDQVYDIVFPSTKGGRFGSKPFIEKKGVQFEMIRHNHAFMKFRCRSRSLTLRSSA